MKYKVKYTRPHVKSASSVNIFREAKHIMQLYILLGGPEVTANLYCNFVYHYTVLYIDFVDPVLCTSIFIK